MSTRRWLATRSWVLPLSLSLILVGLGRGHAETPLAAPASASAPPAALQGDAVKGKELYQACTACHSIDDDDIGPRHRGVFGRKAGTVPGYAYSPALKASGIVWDQVTLDRWLTNPSDMVNGTKMYYRIDNPRSRADIIAYLAELH